MAPVREIDHRGEDLSRAVIVNCMGGKSVRCGWHFGQSRFQDMVCWSNVLKRKTKLCYTIKMFSYKVMISLQFERTA